MNFFIYHNALPEDFVYHLLKQINKTGGKYTQKLNFCSPSPYFPGKYFIITTSET